MLESPCCDGEEGEGVMWWFTSLGSKILSGYFHLKVRMKPQLCLNCPIRVISRLIGVIRISSCSPKDEARQRIVWRETTVFKSTLHFKMR